MISRWNRKKKQYRTNYLKKIRRIKRRHNKYKRVKKNSSGEIYYSNKVFYFLKSKEFGVRNKNFPNRLKRKIVLSIPKSFSISENPDETIQLLKELFYYGSDLKVHEIEIDHSECLNLEIAASTMMDIIVIAIREYHRKNKSKIIFSGKIPTQGKVKDIFMASGLGSHLKLNISSDVQYDLDKMELFDLKYGYYNSGYSDLAATSLAEYIIRCMNTQGYTLSDSGRNALSMLFGEVINNCEIHGGSDSTWFVQGHYQINDKTDCYGEVQLVIFNFGNTIYEQMLNDQVTEETKEKLEYLKQRHLKYFCSGWDEEMLYTLFSLQEGISRLRDKDVVGNRKRGTGTIRLIENFQNIGQTHCKRSPLMTITSGNTHIAFDGKYELKKEIFNDEVLGNNARKIIAFNQENDIFQPPDFRNVYKMKRFFPGTIISFDFFFDKEYFKAIVK